MSIGKVDSNKTIEIERRWLLKKLPPQAMKENVLNVQQWYDETDRGIIRYRCWHDTQRKVLGSCNYEKIIKMAVSKGVNTEEHFPVEQQDFIDSLRQDMRFIEKTRYVFHYGQRFEIDVFHNIALIILECELNSLEEKIGMPDFLEKEIIMEITGMKEFSNYNLAKRQ